MILSEILNLLRRLSIVPNLTYVLITRETYYNIMNDPEILRHLDIQTESIWGCKLIVTDAIPNPYVITEVAHGQ